MKNYCLSAMVLLMALSGAAIAKDKDKSGDKDKAPKEKLICHTEQATGSLTRVNRICMTAEQWNQTEQATRDDVHRFDQAQSRFQTPGASNPGANGY